MKINENFVKNEPRRAENLMFKINQKILNIEPWRAANLIIEK